MSAFFPIQRRAAKSVTRRFYYLENKIGEYFGNLRQGRVEFLFDTGTVHWQGFASILRALRD
jgi:hypothetical protein